MRSRIIVEAPPARRSCRRRGSSVHRSSPPALAASSSSSESPTWPSARRRSRSLRREAGSVVRDLEADPVAVRLHADADGRRARVALDVAQRLRRGAIDESLVLVAQVDAGLDGEACVEPARPERREQIGERGLEPGGAEVGRMDLDEERPQRAHGVARPGGRVLQRRSEARASSRPSAAALSEYEIPARSWTTPSWRSAAIRRRSSADASTARTSSISRSSCVRRSRRCEAPGERHLDEPQQHEARRGGAPRTAARSAAGRRDGAPRADTSRRAAASRPARGSAGTPRTGRPGRARSDSRARRGRSARRGSRRCGGRRASTGRAGRSCRSAAARRSRRCARRATRS